MNKDARTRLRAFVDESKAKDYLLVSVALEVSAVQDARDAVRSLILPGQPTAHAEGERPTTALDLACPGGADDLNDGHPCPEGRSH